MRVKTCAWVIALVSGFACFTVDAARTIRVEFGDDWGPGLALSSCAGSANNSLLVLWGGTSLTYTFSGQSDPNFHFDTDTYCQQTTPFDPQNPGNTYFSQFSVPADEPGLRAMINSNRDNRVSAVRYSFLSGPRFQNPNGFQWAFYQFRNEITVVGLYGLIGIPLTSAHSYIQPGVWDGGTDGYNDQYFCFRRYNAGGSTLVDYLGTWNGSLTATNNVCLAEIATLFEDGMEGSSARAQ